MSQGVEVVGLYVRDQDEALAFYVEKLGFRVHTDVRNGDYRWLTVQHPDQPSFQLGLFTPGPPALDAETRNRCVRSWPKARCHLSSWPWTTAAPPTRGCTPAGWSSHRSPSTATAAWTQAFVIRRGMAGS